MENIVSDSAATSSPSTLEGEEQRLILLLGLARHHLFTALDRALGEAAGVTTVQAGALMFVGEEGGCLLGDLSRGLHLDNSAITGLVDRLEKKGLAAREPVPGDRRAWRVALTPNGREAAEKARSVVRVYNESIQGCGPAGDVEGFRRVLEALIARFPQKTSP